MTAEAWLWLAAAGAFAVGDWIGVARRATRVEYVCKPAATLALLLVAATLVPDVADRRTWFVIALALALAGDVFLMLPRDAFVPGLASFLLAHVAYTIGFLQHGGSARELAAGALVALTLGLPVAMRVIAAVRLRSPGLIGPVVAYVLAISVMVATAVATREPLAVAGALLFELSDSLIAWNRFVRPVRWAPVAIMVTYHLAQAGLVLSLAQ